MSLGYKVDARDICMCMCQSCQSHMKLPAYSRVKPRLYRIPLVFPRRHVDIAISKGIGVRV